MLAANLASYRRRFPDRFKLLKEVRRAFSVTHEQFPEAMCADTSRLLLMCIPDSILLSGWFECPLMETARRHVWVYDTHARAHIDVTADQFPNGFEVDIVIVPSAQQLSRLGYTLSDLDGFDELFVMGPYRKAPRFADILAVSPLIRALARQ